MKILCFTAFYLPGYKGGGPIKTIKNLVDGTSESLAFRVITSNHDLGDNAPYDSIKLNEWNSIEDAEVFYIDSGVSGLKQVYRLIKKENYDIIYLNSFFSFNFSIFPMLLARLLKCVVVLGPRGEFSKGAIQLKKIKKNIFIKFCRFLGFHKGVIFQASSTHEAEDIRRVLGSSVDIKEAEDIGSQEFTSHIGERDLSIPLKLVFISRISPKKNLLDALKILKHVKSNINYDIYGPVEDEEYWMQCLKIINELPINIKVAHKGLLAPEQVVQTLSEYDLFFFPTLGENYGHVIAEALCAGLPLLIADTTPWRNLQEHGIGWDFPLTTPNVFSNTIDKLAVMPLDEHLLMRQTVLAWAKEKFTQRDAVEANINMFRYAYEKKQGISNV